MMRKNPDMTNHAKPVMKTRSNIYGWISPEYNQSAGGNLEPDLLRRNRCIGLFPDSPDADSYKILKTLLHQRLKGQGMSTVLVTSACQGEGKTLTAINLSFALAQDFSHTVLLVDCDLRQQAVSRYLGVPTSKGLADYLMDDVPARDLIVWPGIDKFTFISGGPLTHDGSDLLASPRMHALVHEMRNRYSDRCIIFDTSPLLEGAETLNLLPLADCVLLVIEAGRSRKEDVAKALELIPGDKLAGIVLNKTGTADPFRQ